MIKLEIFDQGETVVSSEWREDESRKMGAYRMRWLGRPKPGRWARTTDSDGRVRTYGDVPESHEAPAGHYVARRVSVDGTDREVVKHFTPKTTKSRAEQWRLNNRLGGSGELVIRWAEDTPELQPEAKVHHFDSTEDAYDESQTRDDIADGDVLVILPEHVVAVMVGAHPAAITGNHGELHAYEGGEAALAKAAGGKYAVSVARASVIARDHFAEVMAAGQAEGMRAAIAEPRPEPEPSADCQFDKITLLGPGPSGGTYTSRADDAQVPKLLAQGYMVYRTWTVVWSGGKPSVINDSQAVGPSTCPHRRGAIDLETGAWHCYACGADVFEDQAPEPEAEAEEPKRYGTGRGFTIDQARAAMAQIGAELQANAGRLGAVLDAAAAGEDHPGEYYVMPHGFTAPASRPAARFPYTGLEAGDAFDRALSWAREYVKTSYDIWHADADGSTFIVQVMADGQLVWPRR